MRREVEEDQLDMGGVCEERFEGLEYHQGVSIGVSPMS
jgi:hypothetical protein